MHAPYPVPFIRIDPDFDTHAPSVAQDLLDSGQVLAFRQDAEANTLGYYDNGPMRVAIPGPSGDPIWLDDPCDIEAANTHIPGLLYATFALRQSYQSAYRLSAIFDAWEEKVYPDKPEQLHAHITHLKDGYVIGHVRSPSVADALADLAAGLRAIGILSHEAEEALADAEDAVGHIATIAVPLPRNISAHEMVGLLDRTRRILGQWQRVRPSCLTNGQVDAFTPPTFDDIRTAFGG